MAEERPVNDRRETRLAQQAARPRRSGCRRCTSTPSSARRVGSVSMPVDAVLAPPSPAAATQSQPKACMPDLVADGTVLLRKGAQLIPALPVAADIDRRHKAALRAGFTPSRAASLADRMASSRPMPASKPWNRNERTSGRSGASVGCRMVSEMASMASSHSHAGMAVELLQMIEIMLEPDRVVVAAPQIDHDAPLARDARRAGARDRACRASPTAPAGRTARGRRRQFGRKWQRRKLRMRLAEDGNLMAELAGRPATYL